ncbi:MAG TPA: vWA domain-containing protein, partial [Tepidisphaeraceae bacterium]
MRPLLVCALALSLTWSSFAAEPAQAIPEDKPHIDVVFCIDCSGSMGPVIETAKQKVWAIVNQIAKAKPAPELRIGLIGYGNAMGPFRTFPMTNDLDEVYKNLLTFK